jgi:glycosyltransferase involved in cell wall biosynthesis
MKNQPVHFASALRHPEMIPASSPERPFAPRTLFISTFPPEACGIATFTQDSVDAVDLASGGAPASVFAIERGQRQRYDDRRVAHVVRNDEQGSYRRAALAADAGPYDVVSLQHEFGLYPGDWGRDVLELVTQCRKPIITTLHTLISSPPKAARDVIRALVERSKGIVVMTNAAAALLSKGYGPFTTPVRVIPHGVPIVHRQYDAACKARLVLTGRRVLLTFGLISRGKGLEAMIEAMPAVLRRCPEAMYLIVGATHPKVKEHDGESYREALIAKVDALGLSDAVRFVNRYVAIPELMT